MRKLFYVLIIQFIFLQTSVYGQMFFTTTLQDDNVTYTVKARSESSFMGNLGNTISMQITLVTPAGGFEVDSIENINGFWDDKNSHLAPKAYPEFDYLVFNLQAPFRTDYVAGEEIDLFSFKNVGECTGSLDFIADDDPFIDIALESQIDIKTSTIITGGGPMNIYSGSYGPASDCLMSQVGVQPCELVDSLSFINPTCGENDGVLTVHAHTDNGLALQYSLAAPGAPTQYQASPTFTDLASGTPYTLAVRDEIPVCIHEFGIVELDPAPAAVIISTSATPDECMASNGTITVEAIAIKTNTVLEYSIDEGTTYIENDGFFPDLAAGTYNPRVRAVDSPCYDAVPEIVVAADCVADTMTTDTMDTGGMGTDTMANTNCIYTVVMEAVDGKFTISVIPDRTITFPNNTVSSALFSFKAPTGGFELTNLLSLVDGAIFDFSGIVPAPTEAPDFDYISIGLTSRGPTLPFTEGVKIPLFSFENGGDCTGGQVFLVDNYTDPFYDNGGVSTGQALKVVETFEEDETRIICTQSNNISDCGEPLGGTPINYNTDTVYITLPVEATTTICIGDELEIAAGDIGTVSLCSSEGSVTTTLTDGSNCLDLTTDDHFNQSETICIVHFDADDNTIADTTILVLCPKVELGPDLNICAGETITLNPIGGTGNFMWITSGDMSCTDCAKPEITPTTSTQYILISSENEHCIDTDTLMVNIINAPTVTEVMATQPTNCQNNGQISITAEGGEGTLKYSIDNGTTFQDSPQFSDLGAGDFDIIVANQDETCSDNWPQTVSLAIAGAPSIVDVNVTPPISCRDEKGGIEITATGSGTSDTLEYSIDGGTTWQDNGNFTDLEEGQYNLLVRIQDSDCEIAFENNPVDVSQIADLRITTPPGDQKICSESDRTILLELNEIIADHTISGGPYEEDMRSGNILTFVANPDPDGNLYSVTLTGESGCTITEEFTLTIGEDTDEWTVELTTTPASCEDNDGAIDVVVNGDNNGFTFCWEPNKASGPMREGLSSDSTYSLTVTGGSGCTLVYENIQTGSTCEVPSCNIFSNLDTLDALLENDSITICMPITGVDLSEAYELYENNVKQEVTFGDCMEMGAVYQSIKLKGTRGLKKYTLKDVVSDCEDDFYVRVKNVEDGMDTLDLITMVNTPILNECLNTAATGTENLSIEVCEDNEPSAGILNGIGVGDGDACFGYMPNTDFIGKDFFCLELCNDEICDTTIVQVTVTPQGLIFYTGFSPNEDGLNDVFTIKNIENYPENNVIIYNRWGNRIFKKENYTNKEGWDGTYDKKLSPDGVYFYVVKVTIDDEEKVFSGPITVAR